MEADCANQRKIFVTILNCKKEAKETTYWLRMVACANPDLVDECNTLKKEAHELYLFFLNNQERERKIKIDNLLHLRSCRREQITRILRLRDPAKR